MKESSLWGHLRPLLNRSGKFQKISDRFTPGIPDVLGVAFSVGYALEFKELTGVREVKAKFRPGQLDWLHEWYCSGGVSLIVATIHSPGRDGWVFPHFAGEALERGTPFPEERGTRFSGPSKWISMVEHILSTSPRGAGEIRRLGPGSRR